MKKVKLNKEETDLEKEIRNGEWVSVPEMAAEIKKIQSKARNFLNKNKKINIRISEWDYNKIKARAAKEGLPYQTLLSSVIHKYLTGQLKAAQI
jgi:predicted DNA binding CopG/RHH family protein